MTVQVLATLLAKGSKYLFTKKIKEVNYGQIIDLGLKINENTFHFQPSTEAACDPGAKQRRCSCRGHGDQHQDQSLSQYMRYAKLDCFKVRFLIKKNSFHMWHASLLPNILFLRN